LNARTRRRLLLLTSVLRLLREQRHDKTERRTGDEREMSHRLYRAA
jgi:hypothetical protein